MPSPRIAYPYRVKCNAARGKFPDLSEAVAYSQDVSRRVGAVAKVYHETTGIVGVVEGGEYRPRRAS